MRALFIEPCSTLLFYTALAGLLAFGSAGLWKRLSLRCGLYDEPGERKIHSSPTSLAGGLTVLIASLPFCLLLFAGWEGSFHWVWLAGLLAFFALGLVDDFRELGPGVKFLGQLFFIGILTTRLQFELFATGPLGTLLNFACSFFWFGLVLNSLNFIDNMNGLCAGLGVLLAGGFFVAGLISGATAFLPVMLIFAGALLGLLPWNYPRAKLFLGDSGSNLVGYIAASGSILLVNALLQRGTRLTATESHGIIRALWAFLPAILILGLTLADLGSTFLIRLRFCLPLYFGDTNHLSHRLTRKGLSPQTAVALLWALSALGLFLGLALLQKISF